MMHFTQVRRWQRLACLLLAVAAIASTSVHAHGGIDDGHDDSGAPTDSAVKSTDGKVIAQGNVGLAFGLTALAAAACIVGALLPFLDVLIRRMFGKKDFDFTQSRPFLAGSIAFAAGVLLYLSLGDLYPEGVSHWVASLKGDKERQKASGLISVAILAATFLLIALVKRLARMRANKKKANTKATEPDVNESSDTTKVTTADQTASQQLEEGRKLTGDTDHCDNDGLPTVVHDRHFGVVTRPVDRAQFRSLGIQIAVALLVHNFPEGLATFTTTLASPRIGVMFGIALALHKLPEGVMISLPIYVATGSRWKGFLVAAVIGSISQFLGALFGYLLFVTYWNEAVSGSIFIIVTAILLYTIIANMLPLARSFDPEDHYVTNWTFIGLVFFAIVGGLFYYA